MGFPGYRMTTRHLVGIVALIAIGLVPLNNPIRLWLGLMIYLKFSLVVIAAFLARYGSNRDWWFGFAVCGAAYILLCVPGLWNAVTYRIPINEFNCFDLTGEAGKLIAYLKGEQTPQPNYAYGDDYASIIRFWVTMAVSFAGGYLSVAIESWRRPKDATAKPECP
jgi:hypothetical protein